MTETAARAKSFKQAVTIAEVWCGQELSSRHLGRIAEEVGEQLLQLRDTKVDDFIHHRRGPEGDDPKHALAAVLVDGGRLQVRDERPGLGAGVHNDSWKEDKIARLQTMATTSHAEDPCPEPPKCFLKPKLFEELASTARTSVDPEIPEELTKFLDAIPVPPVDSKWQPKPLTRTCVGTMETLEEFRWMVQAEATRRHFFTAAKRAFVADGSHGNWTLHARHFPDFVPILDFLHAAEYLHGAAKVLGVITLGCDWVRDAWQGRTTGTIARLREALDQQGIGPETLDETHPYFKVQRAWKYLTNHADKMDYPRYRREGLPTTSSLIESQIKEFNLRLKGTEKFWNPSNAEAMLQLVCTTLNDEGSTLADHFETRTTSPFRRTYDQTVAA